MSLFRDLIMAMPKGGNKPYKEYSLLVSSEEKAYINTLITPTTDIEVEIKVDSLQSTTTRGIFGAYTSWSGNKWGLSEENGTNWFLHNTTRVSISGAGGYPAVILVRGDGSSVINGTSRTSSITTSTCNTTLTLFRACGRNVSMKASYVKIKSNTLDIHLVPCQLIDNITAEYAIDGKTHYAGEIGMWDKINDKFYGNAGSGAFTIE